MTVAAETGAVRAGASWAAALPRLSSEDVALRRRIGPLVEQLGRWGPRFAAALPRALHGLWPAPVAEPTGPVLRLELSGSDVAAREVLLDRFPARIGRGDECALRLPSPAVSTEHAELRIEADRLVLLDLRSTNGTKRNGEPVAPLAPTPLDTGDFVEIGPFVLVPQGMGAAPSGSGFALRAGSPAPRSSEGLFLASHPSDRWVRVRWGGETAWVRVPAGWIRAAWERTTDLISREGDDVDPMEEGAAQYVLVQAARSLARQTGLELDLSAWLTPEEARRSVPPDGAWLESEVWLRAGGVEAATTLLFPVPESPSAPPRGVFDTLAWPASVRLGGVRLTVSQWSELETGDALLPDAWWPTAWSAASPVGNADLGPVFVHVRRACHPARLLRSEAGATLRLESTWLDTPGGDWQMAEEDPLGAPTPSSLPVDDLEVQVPIELDRFPVTLGALQRWREGEILTLRQGPSDPVRLVVETGLQRRVLAEGRVVLVNERLGIEILRLLTRLEGAAPGP